MKKKKNKAIERWKTIMKTSLSLMSTQTFDRRTILMKNKFTELDKG